MVDPRDIKIVETAPGGASRSMSGPHLAEEEFWDEDGNRREGGPQGVASIGEDGVIDMTGMGEFQVSFFDLCKFHDISLMCRYKKLMHLL